MPTVGLFGTLDTKGVEYAYIRDRLAVAGVDALIVDVGVLGDPAITADVTRAEVAHAAGVTLDEAASQPDRGSAIARMADGATRIARDLLAAGRIDGVLGLGGTGGTTLVSQVMRALPVGLPKLLVSTVASGDTRPYVGSTDITMMYSIVDIAGINEISSRILANAAAAMAGMVSAPPVPPADAKPVIAATMFGLTTPAVQAARAFLEDAGYEVLVFHATGAGGASMETLIDAGLISGVLDLTTTELADELVGGVFASGPSRLTAAGRAGIPQVVSLGALDMVNFGARETVPHEFADRTLYVHNASVTLMRTSADECRELGRRIAARLNASASGSPATVFVPERGFSGIDVDGQPFRDAEADGQLIEALIADLSPEIAVIRRDVPINDEGFAREMAATLHAALRRQAHDIKE